MPPPNKRNFLISPPASPPPTWESREESPPVPSMESTVLYDVDKYSFQPVQFDDDYVKYADGDDSDHSDEGNDNNNNDNNENNGDDNGGVKTTTQQSKNNIQYITLQKATVTTPAIFLERAFAKV